MGKGDNLIWEQEISLEILCVEKYTIQASWKYLDVLKLIFQISKSEYLHYIWLYLKACSGKTVQGKERKDKRNNTNYAQQKPVFSFFFYHINHLMTL